MRFFKKHILYFGLSALLLIAACASQPAIRVEQLPAYDALFERPKGWTGADGAYTIPLAENTFLWLFGDTWWGDVLSNEHVNAVIVNNTIAIQNGRLPHEATVAFYSGQTPDGTADAFIQPADGRGWLWIYHGNVIKGKLYLFMVQIERTGEPPAAEFRIIETWLGQVDNYQDSPQNWKIRQQRIPWGSFSTAVTLFGSWVLKQGQWIYIYGTTEDVIDGFHHKHMILARAPPGALVNFDRWQFYSNGKWSTDFRKAQRLCGGIANEYSVSYLAALDQYVVVYSNSERFDSVTVRFAANPWGPWGDPVFIYRCPEARRGADIICYAAKGHPDMTAASDELIISYIPNSTDFETMVSDARLYRPRFIKVRFD